MSVHAAYASSSMLFVLVVQRPPALAFYRQSLSPAVFVSSESYGVNISMDTTDCYNASNSCGPAFRETPPSNSTTTMYSTGTCRHVTLSPTRIAISGPGQRGPLVAQKSTVLMSLVISVWNGPNSGSRSAIPTTAPVDEGVQV